ncbi:hypothetical protein P9112_003479 [Eukaryota sp. TZLM1-RC]
MLSHLFIFLQLSCLFVLSEIQFQPSDPSQRFFSWDDDSIWSPRSPSRTSTVTINPTFSDTTITIPDDITLRSLYTEDVTLLIDTNHVQIEDTLSTSDTTITGITTEAAIAANSFELESATTLKDIKLVINSEAKLIEGDLFCTNSKIFLQHSSTLIMDTTSGSTEESILSWGDGGHGRTGTEDDTEHAPLSLVTTVTLDAIASGAEHSLGITRSGRLYSWGNNQNGELGVELGFEEQWDVPIEVDSIQNVVQISAGNGWSMARLVNGEVYTWGRGENGRLGLGDKQGRTEPELLEGILAKDVSAGHEHGLAVLINGTVVAWGNNHIGQLGIGKEGGEELSPVHVKGEFVASPQFVIGCIHFSLFICSHQYLYTTGQNNEGSDRGQLCLGEASPRQKPTLIYNYDKYNVIQASCGQGYTIFLDSEGHVYSCGRILARSGSWHSPGRITALSNVRSIIAGRHEAFALLDSNIVYSWTEFEDPSPFEDVNTRKMFGKYAHFFAFPILSPSITSSDSTSFLEIEGLLENRSELEFTIDINVLIYQNGVLFASNEGFLLSKSVKNEGSIRLNSGLEIDFQGDLLLNGGTIESDGDITFLQGNRISGFGVIESTLINYGSLVPLGKMEIQNDLSLREYSRLVFTNEFGDQNSLLIGGDLECEGVISIDYTFYELTEIRTFELINYQLKSGLFNSIIIACESFFIFELGSNDFTITIINEIIPDLNHISFISPSGTNEDCCGTASVPCLSLSKIIERMGYYGVVYFEKGEYNGVNFDVDLIDLNYTLIGNSGGSFTTISHYLNIEYTTLSFENFNLTIRNVGSFLNTLTSDISFINVDVLLENAELVAAFDSNISISNSDFTIINENQKKFLDLEFGELLIEHSSLRGGTGLIKSDFSNIKIEYSIFEDQFDVFSLSNSSLTVNEVYFEDFQQNLASSSAKTIIFSVDSTLFLYNLNFTNVNTTLIRATTTEIYLEHWKMKNSFTSLGLSCAESQLFVVDLIIGDCFFEHLITVLDSSFISLINASFFNVKTMSSLLNLFYSEWYAANISFVDSHLMTFLESKLSRIEIFNVSFVDSDLFGNFAIFDFSFAEFDSIEIGEFTCSTPFHPFITSSNSTIFVNDSFLTGCFYDNEFYFEFYATDSNVYLSNFPGKLAISGLYLTNSILNLNTNNPILIGFIESSNSSIAGNDKFLNLEFIDPILNQLPECAPTSGLNIIFSFKYAELIDSFGVINLSNSLFYSFDLSINRFAVLIEDVYTKNRTLDYLEITLDFPFLYKRFQTRLVLCPPYIEFPKQLQTSGGIFEVDGEHLGRDKLIFISDSIDLTCLNFQISHSRISLFVPAGFGCHDVTFNRGQDQITTFMTFCFEPPRIFDVIPSEFSLHSSISIVGQNFYNNSNYVSLFFNNVEIHYAISEIDHNSILVNILNYCNISVSPLEITVNLSNYYSNIFQLSTAFPIFNQGAVFLTPFDSHLTIDFENIISLNSLASCNNMDVESNVPINFTISNSATLTISFDIFGLDSFWFYLQFSDSLYRFFELTVIDFEAQPVDYMCIVDLECVIKICPSSSNSFISNYSPISDSFIEISNYYFNLTCMVVELISSQATQSDYLWLCTNSVCLSIQDLPVIIKLDSITPSLVQYRFKEDVIDFVLVGVYLAYYGLDYWKKSIYLDDSPLGNVQISATAVSFVSKFSTIGSKSLKYCGFYNSCTELFKVNCQDFLTIVPVFFNNSELIIHSSFTYSSLTILVGNELVSIEPGYNSFFLSTEFSVIAFENTVKSVFINLDLPQFLGLFSPLNFEINLDNVDVNFDLFSFTDCLAVFELYNTTAFISITGISIETCSVAMKLKYFESTLERIFTIQILNHPRIEFMGRNYFAIDEDMRFNVLVESDHECLEYQNFEANDLEFSLISSTALLSDSVCNHFFTFEVIIASLDFNFSILTRPLLWNSPQFQPQNVTALEFLDIELFSNSTVSVFQTRDVIISINSDVFRPDGCLIDGRLFEIEVNDSLLLCKNVIVSSYTESVNISLKYGEIFVGKHAIFVEPFFEELCYVHNDVSLLGLNDIQSTTLDGQKSINPLFNQIRCCLATVGNCYISLNEGDVFTIDFVEDYAVNSIIITTNSSCSASFRNSPLNFVNINNSSNELWNCQSIPNGFDFALMCSYNTETVLLDQLTFSVLENLLLFEVEIFGYKLNKCLTAVEPFLGVTVSNQQVFVDGEIIYQGVSFSQFTEVVPVIQTNFGDQLLIDPIDVNFEFISSECYYPVAPLSSLVKPLEPFYLELVNSQLVLENNFLTFSFECFDFNRFKVRCVNFSNNFDVIQSSFDILSLEFIDNFAPNTVRLTVGDVKLGNNSLVIHFYQNLIDFNVIIVQINMSSLVINLVDTAFCDVYSLFHSSCTVFGLEPVINNQFDLFNSTENLTLEYLSISIVSTSFAQNFPEISLINSSFLQIIALPKTEIIIKFTFKSTSTNVLMTTNDCDSTRVNLHNECHCKPGTVLASVGECEPCQLNYYLDNPLLGECIGCPIGKITKSIGSSNFSECICPKSQFDDGKSCVKCPKFSTCEYGELATVANGYKFNLETGSISCPYRYSCRNNQCRFNTKGVDCTECIEGTQRFGFVCFEYSLLNLIISFATLLILSFGLVSSHSYILLTKHRVKVVLTKVRQSRLPTKAGRRIARNKGHLLCPYRAFLSISVIFNGNFIGFGVMISFPTTVFGGKLSYGQLMFQLFIFLLFRFCKNYLHQSSNFSSGFFLSFCFFSVVTALFGNIFGGNVFYFENLILLITSIGYFYLFYKNQRNSCEFHSAISYLILLFALHLPSTYYFSVQSIVFVVLTIYSCNHNSYCSAIVAVYSIYFLLFHVFSFG